ncbi:hypothetical protein MNV49_001495 [Pseudohyphozyma bogoriensis]|nr:hypothetical protein MNV49_001495 [Pseudohyphozyma bogoriensis]
MEGEQYVVETSAPDPQDTINQLVSHIVAHDLLYFFYRLSTFDVSRIDDAAIDSGLSPLQTLARSRSDERSTGGDEFSDEEAEFRSRVDRVMLWALLISGADPNATNGYGHGSAVDAAYENGVELAEIMSEWMQSKVVNFEDETASVAHELLAKTTNEVEVWLGDNPNYDTWERQMEMREAIESDQVEMQLLPSERGSGSDDVLPEFATAPASQSSRVRQPSPLPTSPRRPSASVAPPTPPSATQGWFDDPAQASGPSTPADHDPQLQLDIERLESLNLTEEDMAAIRRLWQPIEHAPHPDFMRTIQVKTTFGWVSPQVAEQALQMPSPFADDPERNHQYQMFLKAQTGESRDLYTVFFAKLTEFADQNRLFAEAARSFAARPRTELPQPEYDADGQPEKLVFGGADRSCQVAVRKRTPIEIAVRVQEMM